MSLWIQFEILAYRSIAAYVSAQIAIDDDSGIKDVGLAVTVHIACVIIKHVCRTAKEMLDNVVVVKNVGLAVTVHIARFRLFQREGRSGLERLHAQQIRCHQLCVIQDNIIIVQFH